MSTLYPKPLRPGDETRVVAPAQTLGIIGQETRRIAKERLEGELGLMLTFGKHVEEKDRYNSSSIKSRVEDLHEAFADKRVKAILTVIGGFNSEELLESLDWNLIKKNPKIFCGFSDITTLSNAIYAKTGLVTFSGPHYSSFGMKRGFEYTMELFKKAVIGVHRHQVLPSANWSDDAWFMDQEKRTFIANTGLKVVKTGKARGTIVGGNLSTLILLGRDYLPKLEGSILFIEECSEGGSCDKLYLLRNLGTLTRTPGFDRIKGLVIGRFPRALKIEADGHVVIRKRRRLPSRCIIGR